MELEFEAIGTRWHIRVGDRLSLSRQRTVELTIHDRIERFSRAYSRFRPDSTVTELSQSTGRFRLPDDAGPMFKLYREMYELTGGQVTPLVGGMMADAGYDSGYGFKPTAIRTVPEWDEVMRFEDPHLITERPVELDFGAAGKGYVVDLVGEELLGLGLSSFSINAGGDLRHWGTGLLRVGLEDPTDTSTAIGVIQLKNQSLCASATNRRRWKGYHHVMNPAAKRSHAGVAATWAMADSALLADMLTTSLFFADPDELRRRYDCELMVIYEDDRLVASPAFKDNLFGVNAVQ